MKYTFYILKHFVENLFIYPFVLMGRLIGGLRPLSQEYEVFFFFSFYHIGGADKVHYQIARATGSSNCIIFFTRKSLNALYYEQFRKSGCKLVDISRWTDNKLFYFNNLIWRGIISYHINRQKNKPVVFNGQCNFGYKLSPWINSGIAQIELIHSLCSFSYIRIPFIQYYYRTVMISKARIADHEKLYARYGIPNKYKINIRFILNGIPLPETKRNLDVESFQPLKILYVGRHTEEKRVALIARVAEEVIGKLQLNCQFSFMGDVKHVVPGHLHQFCEFLGNQFDDEVIHSIYMDNHVLLMLSTTEGFPMAIMEAMARGLTVVSTAVGEIPVHVSDDKNGYLIGHIGNNDFVREQAVQHLVALYNNHECLREFGQTNIAHAFSFFGLDRFEGEYKQLFREAREAFA